MMRRETDLESGRCAGLDRQFPVKEEWTVWDDDRCEDGDRCSGEDDVKNSWSIRKSLY